VIDAAYDVRIGEKLAQPTTSRREARSGMLGHMRPLLARVLAALFAAAWIVFPGFGAVDLSVTWSSDWPQVLEAGWGLFFTVLVGAAFVALAFRPCSAAPVAQLAVAALALAVSVVAGREAPLAWVPVLVAVETLVVAWLAGTSWLVEGVAQHVPADAVARGDRCRPVAGLRTRHVGCQSRPATGQ